MVRARRPGRRDGGASPAGAGQAAGADRAEEVLPHRRQLRRPPRGTAGRRLVAPGAQGDRVLPERRRDHRPGRRHRLPGGADQRARLRARARHHHRQGRQVLRPRGGRGLRRRVHGLQRHHGPRHPAPGDAVRRVLVLQGDRHLLPGRPLDRDQGRGAGRPGAGHGAAGQRPGPAARQHRPDAHLHPAPGRLPADPEIVVTITGPLHVLIAGGGLSGLALAQGLIKDGHTCEVFERDADDSRKIGYYLHMNADGGEALRRTLRAILRARLGDSFHPSRAVTGYSETPGKVSVKLADGTTAEGDVLVGADGIRSAVRGQRLPGTTVIDTGVRGLGVFGRTPLTAELAGQLPPHLFEGVIIAADRAGSRLLISVYRPRQRPEEAAAAIAPDVTLEPVGDYVMISCSVAPGTVIPPAAQWTPGTPAMLRQAMLDAIEGWHPAARALVAGVDLSSVFVIPFGFLEPAPPWEPSRVTLVGDAAHAMLPTLGLGANLALRDAASLLGRFSAAGRGEVGLVPAIGIYEQQMRDYVYPFMRMTMDHDRQFGGGALEGREQRHDALEGREQRHDAPAG